MMARTLSPSRNDPEHDLIATPAALARTVVEHFRPSGHMLDPARGNPTHPFYDAMCESECGTVDWCEIRDGRSFFAYTEHCDWIITNPPWSDLRRFLNHAMRIADNVVFVVTLVHLDTRARDREIHAAGFGRKEALLLPQPPLPWPPSGFLLTAYHLQRGYTGDLHFNRSLIHDDRSADLFSSAAE